MNYCKRRDAEPCIQYRQQDKESLTDFVLANGGNEPEFDGHGIAIVGSQIRDGSSRMLKIWPGSWLRSPGQGRFIATSAHKFKNDYELI